MQNPNFILDILYGKIPFSGDDLKLFQTKEMQRLRKVSVGTAPSWCVPEGTCCSRFEHSVGVWHLAKILGEREEFQAVIKDLAFAALAHDLATPPFSHSSGLMMEKILGKDHEEMVGDILFDSDFGREVARQGGNLRRIADLILQKDKFSDLINNTIDLDNLDNTLRYALSIGLLHKKSYDPEALAKSFVIRNKRLSLLYTKDLIHWERCREVVYRHIYDTYEEFIIPLVLDLAFQAGDLTKSFFALDDYQAVEFLKNECNERTRRVIRRVEEWQRYEPAYNFDIEDPAPETAVRLSDSDLRLQLSKNISEALGLPVEDVCVGVARNKGFKQIHLPIIGADGGFSTHQPSQKPCWYIRVFVYGFDPSFKKTIEKIVCGTLNI